MDNMNNRVAGIIYRPTVFKSEVCDCGMEEMMLGGGEDSKTEFFKSKFYDIVTYILLNEKSYI